jgi:hypothetical protein
LLFFATGFYSCTQNPNGGIPFYMRIDSAALVTNYATQGANTQNITDVWVQAGTANLGAYQMPCNFPVLQQNNVFFIVNAGIEVSGLLAYREPYPFYQIDTFTINATPGNKYSHKPVFRYSPAAIFTFTPIDFQFNVPFDSMTACTDTNAIYGHRCGQITVTAAGDSNVLSIQSTSYAIPTGREVWMEVDYKCDVPFNIGFFANYSNGNGSIAYPEMYVFAQPKWTKLYISFTDDLSSAAADSYNIYFEGLRPLGSPGGHVYVDNVKLIHF